MSFWTRNSQSSSLNRREPKRGINDGSHTIYGVGFTGGWNCNTEWFLDFGPIEGVSIVDGDSEHDSILASMRDWLKIPGNAPVSVTTKVNSQGKVIVSQ